MISDTESIGEAEAIEQAVSKIEKSEGDDISMQSVADDIEVIKSEAFKNKGNEYFKGKLD